jgi:hypothetical protein
MKVWVLLIFLSFEPGIIDLNVPEPIRRHRVDFLFSHVLVNIRVEGLLMFHGQGGGLVFVLGLMSG